MAAVDKQTWIKIAAKCGVSTRGTARDLAARVKRSLKKELPKQGYHVYNGMHGYHLTFKTRSKADAFVQSKYTTKDGGYKVFDSHEKGEAWWKGRNRS